MEHIAMCTSFEIMKYGDAEIYLIELCDCNSKMELERCERSHIESIECVNKTDSW
jgi:hypothetical protein